MKKIISRRNAIKGVTAGGFLAGTGLVSYASMTDACTKRLAAADADILFAFIASPREAEAIGRAFNGALAHDVSFADLKTLSPELDEACRLSCKASAVDRIDAVFRAEFAASDIKVVRGWVLSKSEALVCALWAGALQAARRA